MFRNLVVRRCAGMMRSAPPAFIAAMLVLLLAACGAKTPPLPRVGSTDTILAFGDSLTFGTGASESESYPVVLASLIQRTVISAGVPGERTDQALERLPQTLEEHAPKLVLLCLGGNDMLQKVPEQTIRANLRAMIDLIRQRGASVVLIGVPEPKLFSDPPKFYAQLAKELNLAYESEALDAVLHDQALKSDTVHPNAQGYRRIAQALAELLREAGAI